MGRTALCRAPQRSQGERSAPRIRDQGIPPKQSLDGAPRFWVCLPVTGCAVVAVDDAAAVGCDVHAAEAVGNAGDDESGVVPVMGAVVDLRPCVSTVGGAVEAPHAAHLAGSRKDNLRRQ